MLIKILKQTYLLHLNQRFYNNINQHIYVKVIRLNPSKFELLLHIQRKN
jgi:hypothetical protein